MGGLVLVWGTAFAAIRVLGTYLTPLELTWFRYVPFLAIFGVWLLLKRRDRFRLIGRRDWMRYLVVGALGVFGYHLPLYYGMQDDALGPGATAATGAILVATTPLWTLFIAVALGQERLGLRKAIGSIIAFGGVVLIVLWGRGDADLAFARKALLVLLAPLFWGLYNLLGKTLADRHGSLFFTGLTMCLGTLMLAPFGLWVGIEPLEAFDGRAWAWMAYLSLAATVAGYAIWNFALRRRRPSEVTAYIYVIPVVATAAGWLLLDEAVTIWFLAGGLLVLVGLAQINKARVAPRPTLELAENP